jgi:hypothetical protein
VTHSDAPRSGPRLDPRFAAIGAAERKSDESGSRYRRPKEVGLQSSGLDVCEGWGPIPWQTLLPYVICKNSPRPLYMALVAASQALWSYLFDHQEFMQGYHQRLISFWPMVLDIAGSLVLRSGFAGIANEFQIKTPNVSISLLLVRP